MPPPHFLTYLGITLGMACISLVILTVAARCGFFSLPPSHEPISYQGAPYLFLTTLLAFALFLILESEVAPYIIWLTVCMKTVPCHLDYLQKGWTIILTMVLGGVPVIALTLPSYYNLRNIIWGRFSIRNLGMGIISWCISYPTMMTAGMLVATIVTLFTIQPPPEQMAVQELRHIHEYPLLRLTMAIALVTLVPITEEALFRGLLQNTLRCLLPRSLAIPLAALTFALFHFSPNQGVANYQLLASLFTLACFLGFLYERQRSLWAPIALHAVFNGISVARIYI